MLRNIGLQKRIIIYTTLGLLLVLAIMAYAALEAQRNGIQRILDERLLLAQTIAGNIDSQLAVAVGCLQRLAIAMDLTDEDLGPEKELMRNAQRLQCVFFSGLWLLDSQVKVLWTEPYRSSLVGYDLSRSLRLRPYLVSSDPVVTDVVLDPFTGEPLVGVVVPLKDMAGQVAGRLVGAMDLAGLEIERLLPAQGPGKTGYTQVVDKNGMVVAHTMPERRFKVSDHAGLLSELLRSGQASANIYTTVHQGEEETAQEVITVGPASRASWAVAVEQYEEELLAPLRALRDRTLGLGALALLAAIIGAWLTTRQVVAPIRVLGAASRRIAFGDLDTPVEPMGRDEVGQLADDFESMRRMLKTAREELIDRNRQLEARDKARTQFIANVAHDYKNPLTVVMGLTELLMARSYDVATQRSSLGLIHQEARRLNELVSDVLDVSRLEAGGQELRKEDTDPREVIDYCLGTYQVLPGETLKHQFIVDVWPEVSTIPADRARITQVMMNLIGNAVKYSPKGGTVTIQCRLGKDGKEALLSVMDQGVGIPAEAMEDLFKPFFRVKDDSTKGISGTGLGLTICQYIVEAQGGRIWAESEGVGKGSTFYVALPLVSSGSQ